MTILYEKHNLYPKSILIRRFIGEISVDDIIDSWEYLRKNKLINKVIKGVINDLSHCKLIMDIKNFKTLISYIKEQEQIKKIKLAVISVTPEKIIFPFLGEEETELKIRPFSTIEAATKWICV